MNNFKVFLSERFKNAVGDKDIELKRKYVDQVWDVLQKSYAEIGGIKGRGFSSKEDMIENIPMWKMAVQNEKVVAVIMYKDSNGRKSVAIGTDGSEKGKERAADMVKNDLKRSYGEKSKAALGLLLKLYPTDVIEPFIKPIPEVEKLLGYEVTPIAKVPKNEWPDDAKYTLNKFPYLIKYGYLRELGDELHFKIMLGTPRKNIL